MEDMNFVPPDYSSYLSDFEMERLRKRNAIAYSLQMGKTYKEISATLNVSPQTIAKVSKMLRGGDSDV